MDAIIGALKSKTMWAAVIVAILGSIVDPVNAWVAAHAGWASAIVAAMFAALRTQTTQSLTEKGTGSPSPPASP